MDIFGMIQHFPLSITDVIAIGLLAKTLVGYAMDKQWQKLADEAQRTALPLFNSIISNEEKRDRVIEAMYAIMPIWFKKFVTDKQLEAFFDQLYATQLKAEAERLGLHAPDPMKYAPQNTPPTEGK